MNKTYQNIAIFPLKLFLLPGEYTQLYIFEERYKQLVNDSVLHDKPFGISFTDQANGSNLGCLVEISEVSKIYPGGEMDIVVKSTALFKLINFDFQASGKLYPGGDVEMAESFKNEFISAELEEAFRDHLKKDEMLNEELLQQSKYTVLEVVGEFMMPDKDKLDFCLCKTTFEREKFLFNYIKYIYVLEVQEQSTFQGIYLN